MFVSEVYQTLQEEVIPFLYNFFQKVKAELLLNSFCEASIAVVAKRGGHYKKRKLQTEVYVLEHRYRNPQQVISKLNPTVYIFTP